MLNNLRKKGGNDYERNDLNFKNSGDHFQPGPYHCPYPLKEGDANERANLNFKSTRPHIQPYTHHRD